MAECDSEQRIKTEQPTPGDQRITAEEPLEPMNRVRERNIRKALWPYWCWLLFCLPLGMVLAHVMFAVEAVHFTESRSRHSHLFFVWFRPVHMPIVEVDCGSGMTLGPGVRDTPVLAEGRRAADQLAIAGRIAVTGLGAISGALFGWLIRARFHRGREKTSDPQPRK
jgi:hypothetical protein